MIAVYLVVAFHAGLSSFRGGFIGVDVFFVLSGFLVTSILLRDISAIGHVRGVRFYARRVRRILPAALVALTVIAIAYAVVATPAEMLDSLGGFKAACLYVANWYFIKQSTNYFAANINASPVLHFWSLAVEEQFYLAWPLVLGAIYFFTRPLRWRWWIMRALVVGGLIVSAVAAWQISGSNLNRAYYGTDTRVYQLLAGALLALTPQVFRIAGGRRIVRWVAAVAAAGIVVDASSMVHAGPIARGYLSVAATAIAIVALDPPIAGATKRLLSSDSLAYLGRISYGTYLWHWPIVVIVLHEYRIAPVPLFVLASIAATALAAGSFRLLEQPIRRSARLDRYARPAIVVGVLVSVVIGLLFMPAVLDSSPPRSRSVDWQAARSDVEPLPDCLHASIERCTVVHGTGKRILLIGDSYAQMWMPAIEQIARSRSMTLAVAAMDACPWQRGLFYVDTGDAYRSCSQHQRDWYTRIVPGFAPDIIVLAQAAHGNSQSFQLRVTFPDGQHLGPRDAGYWRAYINASAASLAALRARGRQVVVFEPTPDTYPFDPLSCLSTGMAAARCAHTVDATPSPLQRYYRNLPRADAVRSIDLDRVVCPRLPLCDAVVSGIVVRRDANGHITATYARHAVTQVDQLLAQQGVLR